MSEIKKSIHRKVIKTGGLNKRFKDFIRNGVWGTCTDCPRDSEGNTYPEMCKFFERNDHQISLDNLVGSYKREYQSQLLKINGGD